MAQIDLQRKRGGTWWPWVLGLILLLLLVWVLVEALGRDTEPAAVAPDTVGAPPAVAPPPTAREYGTADEARAALPGTVQEYEQTCTQAGEDPADMGMQHEFTVNCMQLMAASFDAAVQSDTVGELVLDERVESFRSNGERLEQSDPAARDHADIVAESMRSAAELMATLREERFPDDQQIDQATERVREAADSMTSERPMLEQQDTVEQFFQSMGDALRRISDTGTTGAAGTGTTGTR